MSVERLAVLSASASFVGLLGYLIRNRQAMHLVAGYDPERVRDEEGLANFVGTNLYYVMALTLSTGVLDYLGVGVAWVAYVIVLVGLVVRMRRGSKQYS